MRVRYQSKKIDTNVNKIRWKVTGVQVYQTNLSQNQQYFIFYNSRFSSHCVWCVMSGPLIQHFNLIPQSGKWSVCVEEWRESLKIRLGHGIRRSSSIHQLKGG